MDIREIEDLLNHDGGMQGLCGVSDMRDVQRLARHEFISLCEQF